MVICLERGADLHTAQLMSLPLTVSCFSKIQIGFTFLVPAHPGSLGKRAVKRRACVCACAPQLLYDKQCSQEDFMLAVNVSVVCFELHFSIVLQARVELLQAQQQTVTPVSCYLLLAVESVIKKVKIAHTRLPSIRFQS